MSRNAPRLYLVTDRNQTLGRRLGEVVADGLRGGVDAVQLREKDLATDELLALARELRELTRKYHAALLINDRIDVALAAEADGIHLPGSSFATEDARSLLGPDRLIAVSTHSIDEARRAAHGGADFLVFGPVFDTPSKRRFGAPQGTEHLKRVVDAVDIPVIAIGGIDETNGAAAAATGCHGIATIRAITESGAPEAAARQLRAHL